MAERLNPLPSALKAFGWILLGAVLAYFTITAYQSRDAAEQTSEQQNSVFANSGHNAERYQKYLELQKKNRFWAEEIMKGGYILHIRHAQREKWRDATAFDAYELYAGIDPLEIESGQYRATCITRRGIEEARLIQKVFEIAEVKVSRVISSPSCRARMTANYAFGSDYEIENSLLNRTAMMPEQHREFDERLRRILMELEIKPGSNVVLTGHGATLAYAGNYILDEVALDSVKDREETGIYVIERDGDRLILHYTFTSIRDLANVVIRLPVERND